ncbi:MAG TPA: nucleoside deaminase [Candidatus Kapabacteria bacterium]|nr:nucleoside deaminase [Candidatus Kapabacteria bacterium]
MEIALKEAEKSLAYGDVPIGAIITNNGRVIGRGHNKVEKKNNSILHAELIAINSAIKKIGYKHLLNCEMYITLEPCSMCAGAIILSRIKKIYIASKDAKSGAGGSILNILQNKQLNHRCDVEYGLLENDSSEKIKNFFKELRTRKTIGN